MAANLPQNKQRNRLGWEQNLTAQLNFAHVFNLMVRIEKLRLSPRRGQHIKGDDQPGSIVGAVDQRADRSKRLGWIHK